MMTLPAVLPPEPPLRPSDLQMMVPPKLVDPPLMVTAKFGARIDAPSMWQRSPKLAGRTSGPCTALPPLKMIWLVPIALGSAHTRTPWIVHPPGMLTLLGDSIRMTPRMRDAALNVGLALALMRTLSRLVTVGLPVRMVTVCVAR